MSKKRIEWLDMSKGFGIISVVVLHSILFGIRQDNVFLAAAFEFIAFFAMPLFFFISGWLFELKKNSYELNKAKSVKNKFLHIMVPYLSFSVINYVILWLCSKIAFLAPIAQLGSTDYSQISITSCAFQIITYQGSLCKSLWFLYVLFIFYVLSILFPKFMKNPIVTVVLFCLPFISYSVQLPTIISYFCAYSAYFSLGRLIAERSSNKTVSKPAFWGSLSFFVIVGITAAILKFYGVFDGGMIYILIPLKFLIACIIGTLLGLIVPVLLSDFIIKKIPVVRFLLLGIRKKG